MNLVSTIRDGDWVGLRRAIQKLSSEKLGPEASPTFAGVTLGNTGLHLLDTNASHDLIIAPGSDLTADRILTITTGDSDRTITLSGNPTLADWFDQSVKQTATPTFASLIIADAGYIGSATSVDAIQIEADGSVILAYDLTAVSLNDLYLKLVATRNIGIGGSTTLDALDVNPEDNIAIGVGAGSGITNGDVNIFIGTNAGYSKTTSSGCVAIGHEAAYAGAIVGGLTAIGYQAMRYHTGGNGNTAVGYQAGLGAVSGCVYTYNTFIGEASGVSCHQGGSNTCLGKNSGHDLNDGHRNVFLGFSAGYKQANNSDLLIVDNQARADAATELTNAILYGVMAAAPADQTLRINADLTVSGSIVIGNDESISSAASIIVWGGGTVILEAADDIKFKASGNILSYLKLFTDANNPTFTIVGIGDTINFTDENLKTTGNLTDGTNSLTIAQAKTAYTHSQDNTQAHTDYLLNSGNDSTSGILTAAGFYTTGDLDCGEFRLNKTTQDYLFTDLDFATTALAIQSRTAAAAFSLNFYAKTGDGSESVQMRFWAKSTPASYTNYESLIIGYNAATITYEIYSNQHGTGEEAGIVRPIHIWTEGNANQMVFQNDGDIEIGAGPLDFTLTMANSVKNPTTDAPADWVEVKIGGTTYFLPAYVAS